MSEDYTALAFFFQLVLPGLSVIACGVTGAIIGIRKRRGIKDERKSRKVLIFSTTIGSMTGLAIAFAIFLFTWLSVKYSV